MQGKAFGDRAKIAIALLDSQTAYEELKDEAGQSMVAGSYSCAGGDPSVILEQIAIFARSPNAFPALNILYFSSTPIVPPTMILLNIYYRLFLIFQKEYQARILQLGIML